LKNREDEGGRFARAGLGQTEDVMRLKNKWNGLLLDGSRRFIAGGLDRRVEARIKVELIKIH
jgi:hypothetical protein